MKAFGQAGIADTTSPVNIIGQYDVVVAYPSVLAAAFRAKMKPSAVLLAYYNACCVPAREHDLDIFSAKLQEAFSPLDETCFAEHFGTKNWPLRRIIPNQANAIRWVDFLTSCPQFVGFDGIYMDDLTRDIQPYAVLRIQNEPDFILLNGGSQVYHAHYVNHVVSGAREAQPENFILVGNTAGWTQPSLDAISIEIKSDQAPGGMIPSIALSVFMSATGILRSTACLPGIAWYSQMDIPDVVMRGDWR